MLDKYFRNALCEHGYFYTQPLLTLKNFERQGKDQGLWDVKLHGNLQEATHTAFWNAGRKQGTPIAFRGSLFSCLWSKGLENVHIRETGLLTLENMNLNQLDRHLA